jgi:hypothetical protein
MLAATVLSLPIATARRRRGAAFAGPDAAPMPSLAPMVKRVSPAVVNIATRGTIKEQMQRNPMLDDPFFRRFFETPPDLQPRERQFQSAGSGVIIDARNGYIVTNYHVVENASEITITLLDNRSFSAKVLGTDEGSDLALLQAKQPNLVAMTIGDSPAGSGRLRGRDRQSVRPAAHGDGRHRQRARPLRHQSGRLRGLHPDRCLDQSRQFRRCARQPARRAGRHQLGHPVAQRRQYRHRLRHFGQHGQERHGPADQVRPGQARRAGHQHLRRHARHRQGVRTDRIERRAGRRRHRRDPRPRRPASRPATSSPRSMATS